LPPSFSISSWPSNFPTFEASNDQTRFFPNSFPFTLAHFPFSHSHFLPSLSPLAATLMTSPISVAFKELTGSLSPLDSTLTKNRGVGVLWLTCILQRNDAPGKFSLTLGRHFVRVANRLVLLTLN